MPAKLRQVIVLRDVEGRSPERGSRGLNVSAEQETDLLHHARGLVRARLERYFEATEATP